MLFDDPCGTGSEPSSAFGRGVSPRDQGSRLLGGRELLSGFWLSRSRASLRSAKRRALKPQQCDGIALEEPAQAPLVELAQIVVFELPGAAGKRLYECP